MTVTVVSRRGYDGSAFHPRVGLIGNGPHEDNVVCLKTNQREVLTLSPMDRLEAFSWTPILFPFENINREDEFMLDSRMVAALQKVIERVPIVTGHLERIDGTPVSFEGPNSPLQVCVGTRSVWYTSTTLKGSFIQFKESSYNYECLDPNFVFRAANDAILEGKEYPLLTVKVNRFECGSVVLLLTACHLIVDARSMYEFIKTWSQIYSGNEAGGLIQEARHLFSYDDELNIEARKILDTLEAIKKKTPAPFKTTKIVILSIDERQLKSIKQQVNEELAPEWVSSDDLMVCLGWRAFTRARGLSLNDDTMLIRIFDMRKLNQPPLPPTSFGNGVLAAITESVPVAKVLDSNYSHMCQFIRLQIASLTPELIRTKLTALSKVHMMDHPPGGNSVPFSNDVFTSSYTNFLPNYINFQNSPALTVTQACLTDGIISPQPITNEVYTCNLAINSDYAERLANDHELIQLGFKLQL